MTILTKSLPLWFMGGMLVGYLACVALAKPTSLVGTVVSVHDGDTLKCTTASLGTVSIRLLDIDAPELAQADGVASRNSLLSICPVGTNVTINSVGRDRYGRVLAHVYYIRDPVVDGESGLNHIDLSMMQLTLGWAWVYRDYCKNPVMVFAESQAKLDRRGLWAAPSPVPPWQYRKKATAP